jgi:hypothetical protein
MLPVPLGLLWMMYKADPPGYTQPSDFTTEEIETQAARFAQASGLVARTLADERNRTPLDVTFTDAMINGHLRTHSRDVAARLPAWLSNPQVLITEKDIVLMADVHHEQADTVLSVHVMPALTDDRRLAFRIVDQKAGRVPLPDALRAAVADHADGAVEELEAKLAAMDPKRDKRRTERAQAELEFVKATARLCRGEEVTIDIQKYNLRIDTVELAPHRLRLVGTRIEAPQDK